MALPRLRFWIGALALIVLLVTPALGATSNEIVSWGHDNSGVVSQTPTDTGYTAVAAGLDYSLALKADGSIVGWGVDANGQVSQAPAGTGYTAIAAGNSHGLALKADGSIVSWGYDFYGQVSQTPEGTGYTAVAAGGYHSVALKADGSIVSWGYDGSGQVSRTPAGTGYTAIAAGHDSSLALRADGSIVSWGDDNDGQVSDTPEGTGYTAIAAGSQHSLALKADGSIVSWGYNGFRQLSDKPAGTGYTAITAKQYHSLALKADGSIVRWGGYSDDYQKLLPPEGIGYTAVAAGTYHIVALQAVDPLPPVAAFSANTTAGTAPLAVQFTDKSTNGPTSWLWAFGDGATSTGQHPVHVYETAGTYTVTLTAANADGSNSTSRTIKVTAPLPQVNFTWTPEEPVSGEPIQFTGIADGSPMLWMWDFGDGTSVFIGENPVHTHTYTRPGYYIVSLTVGYHSGQMSPEFRQTVSVSAPPIGGSTGYFLVSTTPAGAHVFLRDISGDLSLAGNTSAGPLNVTVHLTGTPLTAIVANLSGYADAVYPIASNPLAGQTVPVNLTLAPSCLPVPPSTLAPTDTDGDGKYDDVNGNGRADFADVVLFFNQMTWIAGNEPVGLFDYNGNGRIDFADVVRLFNNL